MQEQFNDRKHAGELLAEKLKETLSAEDHSNSIILALPRGGVPVAFEIAKAFQIPMEVLIVRKIGHPLQPEYGVGAIAEEGFYWMDPNATLVTEHFTSQLNSIIENEKKEIERRVELYRNNTLLPSLEGKTVILVDDGLATGATARVAIQFIKSKGAKKIILAVPVCSDDTMNLLKSETDAFIFLQKPSPFLAVGFFYHDFQQVSDNEVIDILSEVRAMAKDSKQNSLTVIIPNEGGIRTYGFLNLPADLKGIVIFAHGSGSGRYSKRNQQVSAALNQSGIGTLLFDLLTPEEAEDPANIFNIPLLAKRLSAAFLWIKQQNFGKEIAIGYFGASTGGGAALWAAADLKNEITAVVSRGGRPDLAMDRLPEVNAPTLLIVGDLDYPVIELNKKALDFLKKGELVLIPGATHLFEEPGTLEQVAEIATEWFIKHFNQEAEKIENFIARNITPLMASQSISALVEKVAQSKIVMLGESTHGTQDFYEWRRLISQELIAKHGFEFIAVEGDWPPCAELNHFIQEGSKHSNAYDALRSFHRWPTWMWANTEMIKLADWMKKHNQSKSLQDQARFYGLDVYSLFESMDQVISSLEKINPLYAKQARIQYECFDPFQRNEKLYAKSLFSLPEGCEAAVLKALKEALQIKLDGMSQQDEHLFDAQQNARIVKNAEHYYRVMMHATEDSWNVRDHHMMETLNLLLKKHGSRTKGIVWAHNTHIGDYRATDMVEAGQVNIGGLAREQWGTENVSLIGFGTYQGEVIASHAWDGPTELMHIPPAKEDSYETLFHHVSKNLNVNAFFIWLKSELKHSELSQIRGHRAIGVVYHPIHEKRGNYVPTSLSNRYDGFVFIDETRGLTPLLQTFLREEIPETWPQGM